MNNFNYRMIILPLDGYKNYKKSISAAKEILSEPGMADLILFTKINDGAHLPDKSGPKMVSALRKAGNINGKETGVFLDLKLTDVKNTLGNITSHYADVKPEIITVTGLNSAKGFLEIRRTLPETKIALIVVPTDVSRQECVDRFGAPPELVIMRTMTSIQKWYKKCYKLSDPKEAFDMVVCSPEEVEFLSVRFPEYDYIVPGIRDKWMMPDGQVRKAGVAEALRRGANLVVMGSQIRKGNPGKGISAKESRRRTREEIDKFYKK